MRAKEFIIEDDTEITDRLSHDYQKAVQILTRDCSPYLNRIGGLKNALFQTPLYRGFRTNDLTANHITKNTTIQSIPTRLDRRPKDTPEITHNLIDNWFEKATGFRFRSSSVFTSSLKFQAFEYGNPYIVIPAGEFHYCWSELYSDMYEEFRSYLKRAFPEKILAIIQHLQRRS